MSRKSTNLDYSYYNVSYFSIKQAILLTAEFLLCQIYCFYHNLLIFIESEDSRLNRNPS